MSVLAEYSKQGFSLLALLVGICSFRCYC